MQANTPWGNKHWTQTEVVPEYRKFAKFFDATVPLEGGQLVIVGSLKVEAAENRSGSYSGGTEDYGTFIIVVTVADEWPRRRNGGSGSDEDQAGGEVYFDDDLVIEVLCNSSVSGGLQEN